MTVDILGTKYTLKIRKISEDKYLEEFELLGYCDEYGKTIVLADFDNEKEFPHFETEAEKKACRNRTLRHELVHAFLNESGLSQCARESKSWAKNEEMVDWIAAQAPKMLKVFEQLECL